MTTKRTAMENFNRRMIYEGKAIIMFRSTDGFNKRDIKEYNERLRKKYNGKRIGLDKNRYFLSYPNRDLYEITHKSQTIAVLIFEAFLAGTEHSREYGPIGGWD